MKSLHPEGQDALRLKDLYSYEILDTPPEEGFDELVTLAQEICKVPVSLITLIDRDRQWFKAKKGIDISETSREVAFCNHTILQDDELVVEDATKDDRFCNNPFVTGLLKIRFYAGAPITSRQGFRLGSVCIIDSKPQTLSLQQREHLSLIARQAARLLELHKNNVRLKQWTDRALTHKSQSFRKLIGDYERTNTETSAILHEGIAQIIASGKLYLSIAKQHGEKNAQLINTAIEHLDQAITEVRQLSNKIVPAEIRFITIGLLVKNFLDRISKEISFETCLTTSNSVTVVDTELSTFLLRVLHDLLKVLEANGNEDNVSVHLSLGDEIMLEIRDSCASFTLAERRNFLFDEFYDKMDAFGGTAETSSASNNFLFTISMPLRVLEDV